ncbi:uncharacterized protein PITG_09755 [Phytophthora infestans T30-4]|uniref:HAT C-terminal dimerisation domain-containing protein n=1 Tax=Phytophthora infestans (strain T30-4) TaxID=403677 RepID=D0NCR0_PHYIT|nr:uncharacterized protein PITG_09755 [Phytophthora infestans T30-4]EEY55774.1 conserved hypothetical protein [Phytophthora infestans T30-4]|eukprot:XP_002903350.1 conserved hypothetical protein [Phytophthora infestans T30-4]
MDPYELRTMEEYTQGWVNLLSTVWQNISKDHLLGCQLALFGVLLTYALLPAGNRHHGIAIADQLEQVVLQAQQEKWKVGAIITDNVGQCGCARRILTKVINKFYGKPLGLRTLCETRWNSMQGWFASLLRVQSALQMFNRHYKRANNVFKQRRFIAPLSLASHRLQVDENTVGDVVRLFGNIYKEFQQHLVHQENVIECVEDGWKQELSETVVSGIGTLAKIAVCYYKRLFGTVEIGQLRRDMLAWTQRRFTRMKPMLSITVNTVTCERLFTASKALYFHIVAKHVRK